MVPVAEKTTETTGRGVVLEPSPPKKGKKAARLAVSIRKGRLCFIPVSTPELEEEKPVRSPERREARDSHET